MNRVRITITACVAAAVAALLLFIIRVTYSDRQNAGSDVRPQPTFPPTADGSTERSPASVKSVPTRYDRIQKKLDEAKKVIRNSVPRSAEEIIRSRYADIVPNMTGEQFESFTEILKKHDDLVPARDRGLRDGTYKSYTESHEAMKAKAAEIDRELLGVLGREAFAKYKDDNALAFIDREIQMRAAIIGNHAEPLSQEQINNLKVGYLEAYNIENARDIIFFDPHTFQYSASQYLGIVLKRSKINSDVLADAKNYLSAAQLGELDRQLRLQTRMDLQAASERPKKVY